MSFIDYYKILEIDKSANETDIKKSYRKLARKYHPDLNPNDESAKAKFQAINEANEVLSDPEKRKKYDKYGKDWKHADEFEKQKQQQQQYQQSGSQQGFDGGNFGGGQDYSDFFESMFGGMGGGNGRQRTSSSFKGQDYSAELRLNLLDILVSQKQTLTVNGKSIRLTIPAGIENAQTIKIKGHGGDGANGGPKGDLYISFVIENNTSFKRDGSNLYLQQEIDFLTAILGEEIMVETLSGKVKLTVKPGTQNGTKVKLKGKGMPIYKQDGSFGDLIVTYQVKIPTDLTEKQKELLKEFAKS